MWLWGHGVTICWRGGLIDLIVLLSTSDFIVDCFLSTLIDLIASWVHWLIEWFEWFDRFDWFPQRRICGRQGQNGWVQRNARLKIFFKKDFYSKICILKKQFFISKICILKKTLFWKQIFILKCIFWRNNDFQDRFLF